MWNGCGACQRTIYLERRKAKKRSKPKSNGRASGFSPEIQTAFTTSPERRHRVQTRILRVVPFWMAWTRCRFGYQRRLVLLLAWLTLCPTWGPFPQIAHDRAIKFLRAKNKKQGTHLAFFIYHGFKKSTSLFMGPPWFRVPKITGIHFIQQRQANPVQTMRSPGGRAWKRKS